jgi:DNA-binding transcriptional LysR family regulator
MELRQLRTFDAVVRTMSFTAAAKELHFAQSTVSEQMQNLERELGAALFDRTNRNTSLTPEGRAFSDFAARIIALADEAQRVVSGGATAAPQLTIGALETLSAYRLPSVLTRFHADHPDVRVSLKRGNRGQLYTAASRRQLDLCLTFGPASAGYGLASETLTREPLVVITPLDHELAGVTAVSVGRLLTQRFLVTSPGCGFREMYDSTVAALSSALTQPGAAAEPALEVDSVDALIACVAGGMGCALLPRVAVVEAVRRGHVRMIEVADVTLDVPVTLSWLDNGPLRPHVVSFTEELSREFAEPDAALSKV